MQVMVPFKMGLFALLAVSFLLVSDDNGFDNSYRADDPVGCDETLEHPDYDFLKRFYNATGGDQWVNTLANNNPWLECDVCSWFGVVCDNGNVVEINLPGNNVIGVFDVRAVEFINLKKLDLSNNDFSFTASSDLDYITSLEYLDLSSNHLSINYQNIYVKASNLKYLDLSDNGLNYVLPQIFDLPALEHFNFSNNMLSGPIPNAFNKLVLLKHLDLSSNDITGPFPQFVSTYNRLQYLNFSDNRFTGCIPSSYSFHCDIKQNVFLDDNCTFDNPTFIEFCDGAICDERLNLSGPATSCYGQVITISAESGYVDYEWSPGCDGPLNRASSNETTKVCPGTYYVTVTNEKGCTKVDSIVIGEYIEPNRNTSTSFCEGGSVSVAGRTFDSAGEYQVPQTTAQGCSYILNVSVTEIPRPRNTYNLEICNGSSEDIHGTVYHSAGTYTQDFINQNGCDSLLTINVSILNTFANSVHYNVCPGETASHDGEDYGIGTSTRTYGAQNGCDSILTIHVYALDTYSSSVTLAACKDMTAEHDGISYGIGTSSRTYSAQNGCDSIVTIYVNELEDFETSISLEVCEGESVIHDGLSYPSGTHSRTYVAQNGCDSVLIINVNELEGSNTTDSYTICNGQSVNVFGTDYVGGVYDVPYLNENGCASNLRLTVNETPPYIIYDTIVMCNGVQVNYDDVNYFSTPGSFSINKMDGEGCNYIVKLEVPGGETNREDIFLYRCDNESIEVNGEIITGSLAVQTLTNVSGCDSSLWIHVESRYSTTETMYLDYCFGDFPHINGITYFQPGWHTQNLINNAGCDSTLNFYLTRLDKSFEDLEVQICPNQEITINGVTYSEAGFDQQILENAVGCDSVLNVEIIVKDTIESEFRHQLCGDETITIGGVIYDKTINDVQYYTTSSGCDSLLHVYIEHYEHTFETIFDRLCTGDQLTYNNEEISSGGTYVQNLINANGCDSTLTIIIEEFHPSESYNQRETCEGFPWSENGENFYNAGLYTQTLENAVGCDSIITIDLIVYEHSSEEMDLQVCKDQTRYVNGVPYQTAGSFIQNLTNVAGCDSTLTIHVEIIDEVRAYYGEDICEGESTIINGETFNSTRTSDQYFISSIGCDSILTVSVIMHPHTFGQVETTVCKGSETIVNGESFTEGGLYTQIRKNAAGCDSTITVYIEELLPSDSHEYFEMCEGDPLIINSVTYEYGGEFSQSFTNAVGCDSTYYITILEHPDTEHTIYRYICPGEVTTVNNVDYNIPSIYKQYLSNANGCDSTLFINVEYSPPKDTMLFDFICEEGSYTWKGSVYYNEGIYDFDTLTQRGCDSIIYLNLGLLSGNDTTIYRTICKNDFYSFGDRKLYTAGTYFDEIIIGGCKTPTTLALSVLEPVEGFREVHICDGELFWVNGKYVSEAGLYTETIKSSQGCDSILTTELIYESTKETVVDTFLCQGSSLYFGNFHYTSPGNYVIKRKSSYGCDSLVKLNIEWYDDSIDFFTDSVCEGETVIFEGKEYGAGIHTGEYFDGNCVQAFQLEVIETDIKRINETLTICSGESIEFQGHVLDHSGQYYIGSSIGTCEFVDFVTIIEGSGEGVINELFLCEGSSMNIGDLIVDKAGSYDIESCNGTNRYSVNFINGDTITIEHIINPGQSVYIEGVSYNESGMYFIPIGSHSQCTSMLKLIIKVEACGGQRSLNIVKCEGEVFDFYGEEINEAGTYEFVKHLGFACDSIIQLNIDFVGIPMFEIEGNEVICEGEDVILSGPEGYTYLWSTGETTKDIYVGKSGAYELQVFNDAGCNISAIFETKVVTFPSPLNIYKSDPGECGINDGNIFVDVKQPENYWYSKDGGEHWQESPIFENLGAGNYSILLADPTLSCIRENTFDITLENDGIPQIQEIQIEQANHCSNQKGSIVILMEDEDSPMEYSIDGGKSWSLDHTFSDLDEGKYEILVSPIGSECVNNFTGTIEILDTISLQGEINILATLSCSDAKDAIAEVVILKGKAPYNFKWSNGSTLNFAQELSAGFHSVTIEDANNCVQVLDYEIEKIETLDINQHFKDAQLCDGDTLKFEHLDTLYYYMLFKEDVFYAEGQEFEIYEAGHYQVIARNENNCVVGTDFVVENPSAKEIGADFLMSSQGIVGEEIYVINISDPLPEKYTWVYDTNYVENEIIDSLTQKIWFVDTGDFTIQYLVDHEGCLLRLEKKIKIFSDSTNIEMESPLQISSLTSWSISPNPNDGNFNLEINLSKEGDLQLFLFDMYGSKIGNISLSGKSEYKRKARFPSLQTGIYSLVLIHEENIYQKSIFIIN